MKSINALLFTLLFSFMLLAGCSTTIINETPDGGAAVGNSVETEVDVVEETDVEGTMDTEDEDVVEDEDAVENEEDATAEDEDVVEDEESEASDVSLKSVDDLSLSKKSDIKVGSFDLTIEEEEDSIPKY